MKAVKLVSRPDTTIPLLNVPPIQQNWARKEVVCGGDGVVLLVFEESITVVHKRRPTSEHVPVGGEGNTE